MASQSKIARDSSIRGLIATLTKHYLANRTRISRAVWLTLFVTLVNRVRHAISEQKAASQRDAAQRAARKGTVSIGDTDEEADSGVGGGAKKRKRVELNREFFRALLRLMKIVIPGWKSKEARLLISHTFFLVVRTLISVRVASMDGAIVKSLVKGNGRDFLKSIAWWMAIAVPATFTNSMVSLFSRSLSGRICLLNKDANVFENSCLITKRSCR
jgi:ATP-binding cassette subfamily D (ALD) long-chain fatty acid import protein